MVENGRPVRLPCVNVWSNSRVPRRFVAYVCLSGTSILRNLVKYRIASSMIFNVMTDSYMVMWELVRRDLARLHALSRYRGT